jgi:spore coat protein H
MNEPGLEKDAGMRQPREQLRAFCVLGVFTLLGCGDGLRSSNVIRGEEPVQPGPGLREADPTDAIYDPHHLLEVELEMDPADWGVLREQGLSLFELQRAEVQDFDYTFFDADVAIDGQLVQGAAVRKKGGLGSLSRLRPSLIVELDRDAEHRAVSGVGRLTLNNDRSNSSHNRQCMALELFAKAGLPASRCNLAHVRVNGQDLGTYSNVEPIRKPFLERHFVDPEGNLYEGQQDGDFTRASLERLQIKTNATSNDRSDLGAVARALEAEDGEVADELAKVIDLPQFRRFWALETLTGNWDSYSGNTNNFYAYRDPTSDRFVFFPWSPDNAFTGGNPGDEYNQTLTVYATGAIANRLYNLPQERAYFRALLSELNDTLWDTPALLARLDELVTLGRDAWPGAVEQQRRYLAEYSRALRDELALPAPEWTLGGIELPDSACTGDLGAASGRFETTWIEGPLPTEPGSGRFEASLTIGGQTLDATWFGSAGRDPASGNPAPLMLFVGSLPDGRQALIQFVLGGGFSPGVQPFYAFETVGFVGIASSDGSVQFLGYLSEGQLDIERGGQLAGDPVVGTFEGQIYQTGCYQ